MEERERAGQRERGEEILLIQNICKTNLDICKGSTCAVNLGYSSIIAVS